MPASASDRIPSSPACSTTTSSEDDESFLAAFDVLRSVIKLEKLVNIASHIRSVPSTDCTIDIEKPLYGSFNLVYVITFSDATKWIARIPIHGVKESWSDRAAASMESQALTMRFIKQNTTIPIPEIIHYDTTLDNELGAPFVLMSWLDGKSVSSVWHDSKCDAQTLATRRENILCSVAKAMGQLRFFNANKVGELQFEPTSGEDKKLRFKQITSMHSLHLDEETEDPVFKELGPFNSTHEYLLALTRDSRPQREFIDYTKGQWKLLELMIDAIPSRNGERFLLSYADYDVQNFLVNPEGQLTGVIDWDGIATYPTCIGSLRYPGWITRDWDPLIYGYGDPDSRPEDSPEALRKLRALYCHIVEEEFGAEVSKGMMNSHLYEAIEIACRNPMNASSIICLLARRLIRGPLFNIVFTDEMDDEEDEEADEDEGEDEDEGGGDDDVAQEEDGENTADIPSEAATKSPLAAEDADHEQDLTYIPGWLFDLFEGLGQERVTKEQLDILRERIREGLVCTTHIVE
ncbi:hypothetical protein AMATHDRAFT_44171 [Amanita thiersii Skay4041]|uniref:Aminoglycoside phosphotransferase domain-containing protein n=1 Tax=Amanita thiersii Skay4041 TaxID=703135 RepID=A0A2A9NC40_9AGAR|nr:hypothetical protein AMATHDRAFT_44171 [Amanita thiersii Skay4041]